MIQIVCHTFFILYYGAMLCGRVTVTDGDHRLSFAIYEHIITQQYISDMESPICTHSLSSRNRCLACVHVTKQPSSEEWHIAVDP
jgi:hypothetical protein